MNIKQLINELSFKAVKSSGAGGQHVNKVSTKIELVFNVQKSQVLSETEKELLLKNLTRKLTIEGNLIITCQESRSQYRNKEIAIQKFVALIKESLKKRKKRKLTKPKKSAIQKRLDQKKILSEKKSNRQKLKF
ncbi:alternative ribosome rescue aminoacyl-tRNA hydrolase ArfB [Tenacibaculum sp. 190524A02b]|uniref:alternative ribosome rescue aminoacyl-tRNA hydrolase ArfB n=1 Tax=Tenacibaculum vairaonense TaxID=3137860 RepID=UPI0031FB5800